MAEASFGASFHDFAGSVVVHGVGGWIAFSAVILLGARLGRYGPKGGLPAQLHSVAGSAAGFLYWLVRFNVVSAQSLEVSAWLRSIR